MALVCFASQKGAPGVTLTALAVAAAWPTDGRRKVLVEADADGGSLAVRFQLGRQPGLVSLAAASRHGVAREELWAHAQMLPGGLPIIVAPERADRASAVLSTSARPLALWLASLPDVDVIVDCGRLGPTSAAMPFAQCADYVFMVARPVAEQIQPAAERAVALQHERTQVAWVLIGDRPYAPAEIAAATGVPVAAVLPDDPRAAAALWAGSSNKVRRSPLVRTASTFAVAIARNARPVATPSLDEAVEPVLAEAN